MNRFARLVLAAALGLATLAAPVHSADGIPVQEKTYAISGTTGPDLYASIGEKGPSGAIAHTSYRLQWFRSYARENGGCRLSKLRPEMTIIYTYPKPAKKLPEVTRKRWETFIAGVRKHEQIHGEFIRAFVSEARTAITGTSAAPDPDCAKVKRDVTRRLAEAGEAVKQRNRDFDKVELANGGNVHRLILALVNP